ncbi:hypothetical protein H5410_004459 [Solanum commersonii]|uniref:Uncharacterized protein n=1 Tax=Solanum commersonii TaxID=4109 RepID=A0A9J6B7S1_SOLCO|nr:hypothetical protein H5410_004459 [Solanum commersonii]
MSYQPRDEVYYIEDEYEMEELDYFVDELQGVDLGGFDLVEDDLQGIDLDDFDLDVDELLDVGLGGFDSDGDDELQGELIVNYLHKLGVFFCSHRPKSRMSLPLLLRLKKYARDVDELQGLDLDDFDLDIDEFLCISLGDFDSDVHEYDYMNKRMQDIFVVEVGNDEGFLVDSKIGEVINTLCGHMDYSFESAWHPDGLTFASGNQYKCVEYGIFENLSKSVITLKDDDFEYVVDEYEMEELDDLIDEFQGINLGGCDSTEDELQDRLG